MFLFVNRLLTKPINQRDLLAICSVADERRQENLSSTSS